MHSQRPKTTQTNFTLSEALKRLQSDKANHVNNALIWIRSTFIKEKQGAETFVQVLFKFDEILCSDLKSLCFRGFIVPRPREAEWGDYSIQVCPSVFLPVCGHL